ncbi:MAG: 30S ribosomal protein S8 [Conexivisphaera sp.]
MPAQDVLSNLFSTLYNNERRNKGWCLVTPASRLSQEVLRVLQKYGYVGEFEFIDDGRSGKLRVQLLGRIHACGAIKPRYPVGADGYYAWERRFLPAYGTGILVVSTNSGVMSHVEAREKRLGGRLLGYVY